MLGDQVREARAALLNHALSAMGRDDFLIPGDGFSLEPYIDVVGRGIPADNLTFILSTLAPPESEPVNPLGKCGEAVSAPQRGEPPTGRLLEVQPMALSGIAVLGTPQYDDPVPSSFDEDWGQLSNPVGRFETAAEVLLKHAWAIPCTYGELGVSLYEEFKLLAALVHASGCAPEPAGEYTLIAGDFPGVQNTIYTISSKGAAKGLRGRSFFLQLLSDAVVRSLLDDNHLNLPWVNVIYLAGGNFLLLAGPQAGDIVVGRANEINCGLLEVFRGDVSLSTATAPIAAGEMRGVTFIEISGIMAERLGDAKMRRFAELATNPDAGLFHPWGGGPFCEVCHRHPDVEDDWDEIGKLGDGESWRCYECRAFDDLAYDLAHKLTRYRGFISVGQSDGSETRGWQYLLAKITGQKYGLHAQLPPQEAERSIYLLNDTDFIQAGANGFRFVATLTPVVSDDDANYLKKEYPTDPAVWLDPGDVRTFELLAEQASNGIHRLGILRMDIDNLGNIFRKWIQQPSLARLSVASAAVSLFFDGWLNRIMERVEGDTDAKRENALYLIYAGGDDLFIVGAWDLLPTLAVEIRDDLATYTGSNLNITISAGITLEPAKFPLYRAAEAAKEALDKRAKQYVHSDGHPKDAIDFLGQTVGWGREWDTVRGYQSELEELVTPEPDKEAVPRSLLQFIISAYRQYLDGLAEAMKDRRISRVQLYYGRYHWMLAYNLTRLAGRHEAYEQQIRELQRGLLSPENVRLSGLAARWTEILTRETPDEVSSEEITHD